MQALTSFFYLAPLLILQGSSSASAFTPGQLQSLALMFFKFNQYAFNIDLFFFGLWCVLTAYLIFKSPFLPRFLGALSLITCFALLPSLDPPLPTSLSLP